MAKGLLVFILGVMFWQGAQARQHTNPEKDTALYYMKNSGEQVISRDSADYWMFVMPRDSSSGKKLFPVNEFYPNGKTKLIGASNAKNIQSIEFEGPCITYYPNGHKKSVANYTAGYLTGDIFLYYPNGKLYAMERYGQGFKPLLIECRDSTDNTLAEKGNGKWLKFDDEFKYVIEEGPVKDSLEEGEWKETFYKTQNYVAVYSKGVVISSTDPHRQIGETVFVKVQQEPEYKDEGERGFSKFVMKTLRYPATDVDDHIQGKVIVTFIVEKDGSLTNIKFVKAPDQSLGFEAVRVVKLSPKWKPGMQNGRPVRVQFSVPINFGLADD